MTVPSYGEMAAWARRKRVTGHLTDGRADPAKCSCGGENCLLAQAVADYFDHLDAVGP